VSGEPAFLKWDQDGQKVCFRNGKKALLGFSLFKISGFKDFLLFYFGMVLFWGSGTTFLAMEAISLINIPKKERDNDKLAAIREEIMILNS
jgi:hypothetical protein